MKKERAIQITRLQENLSSLRKIAGWTAEDLGEMLGVSKQNISNLENIRVYLSQAQYIAIRHLLDYQAEVDPQNTTLLYLTRLLVDRLELQGRDYTALKNAAKDIGAAAAIMHGQSLRLFADTLLKASHTRFSDFGEIDGLLKAACESEEVHNWTAELVGEYIKE